MILLEEAKIKLRQIVRNQSWTNIEEVMIAAARDLTSEEKIRKPYQANTIKKSARWLQPPCRLIYCQSHVSIILPITLVNSFTAA